MGIPAAGDSPRDTDPVTGLTGELTRLLAGARDVVIPRIRQCVQWLDEPARTSASYHFGWTDQRGGPGAYLGSGRLMLLPLLSATVNGGRWQTAREAIAAWTVIGAPLLIHDDIVDEDRTRRGRPALWALYGTAEAIHTGDAMLALAFEMLADQAGQAAMHAVGMLARAVRQMAVGQILEGRAGHLPADDAEAVRTAEAIAVIKTGSYTQCGARLGALYAGLNVGRTEAMVDFGTHLGMIIQLLDDVADTWGDPGESTPPKRADLKARKITFPVAAALASGQPGRRDLEDFYRSAHTASEDELRRLADLLEHCGARDWCEDRVRQEVISARRSMQRAEPEPGAARRLADYTDSLTRSSIGDTTTNTGKASPEAEGHTPDDDAGPDDRRGHRPRSDAAGHGPG